MGMTRIAVLLIFGSLVKNGGAELKKLSEEDVMNIIENRDSLTESEYHNLTLSKDGMLGKNQFAITWKANYNNQTVAVKIFWDREAYYHELVIFKALNATEYPNIEDVGIARIFYYGKVLSKYFAIAMSLFEETLDYRFKIQRNHFSDLSILMIFMQTVETLKYLNSKKVRHNDIKPGNIFLRGSRAFISDFRLAATNGILDPGGFTKQFASSNVFAKQDRCAMDDMESLLFTIWYVAGVPQDRKFYIGPRQPEGLVLYNGYRNGKANDKMLKKCAHFKNPIVRKAFETICVDEIITRKSIPDYRRIINVLADAINQIIDGYKPLKFEWVKGPGSWITQLILNTAKTEYQKWKKRNIK